MLFRASHLFVVLITAVFANTSAAQSTNPSCAGADARADSFGMPLGPPSGNGYAPNGLVFLAPRDYKSDEIPATNGIEEFHPGEDWNASGNGQDYGTDNNDAGDPVHAIGRGVVKYAAFPSDSWGYVVMIEHRAPDGAAFRLPNGQTATVVWSQYGHMATIGKNPLSGRAWQQCDVVEGGQQIGTVGDHPSGKKENYHLHFEVRTQYRSASSFVLNTSRGSDGTPLDWNKDRIRLFYADPSAFVLLNPRVGAGEGPSAAFTILGASSVTNPGQTLTVPASSIGLAPIHLRAGCLTVPAGCSDVRTWAWSVSGIAQQPDSSDPSVHVSLPIGQHTVQLRVTDTQGRQSGVASATVVVTPASVSPHPEIAANESLAVALFNVDDIFRVRLNGQVVAEVGYFEQRTLNLFPLLRSGSNTLNLELENHAGAGWAFGFSIRADGSFVVSPTSCGSVGVSGAGCGDEDRTPGIVFADTYTILKGTVGGETTPTPAFIMRTSTTSANDGEVLSTLAPFGAGTRVSFEDHTTPGSGNISSREWWAGSVLLARDVTSFDWTFLKGRYDIRLTVRDDRGSTTHASGVVEVISSTPSTTFYSAQEDGVEFSEPVVDSIGNVVVLSYHRRPACPDGFCGTRVQSISPSGQRNWVFPADGSYLGDAGALTVGLGDRIYLEAEHATIYALDRDGHLIPGWPQTIAVGPGDARLPLYRDARIDPLDGGVVARAESVVPPWYPSVAVAFRPDGSLRWRVDYPGPGARVVFGPGQDVYTGAERGGAFFEDTIERLDRATGTRVCEAPGVGSNSLNLITGTSGVLTVRGRELIEYGPTCQVRVLYTAPDPDARLAVVGHHAGVTYLNDCNGCVGRQRLLAVTDAGALLWSSPDVTVAPDGLKRASSHFLYFWGMHPSVGWGVLLINIQSGELIDALPYFGGTAVQPNAVYIGQPGRILKFDTNPNP